MNWWLVGSVALNGLLGYAWIHDTGIYKHIAEMYQKSYYDTLDFHYGNPEGTTSRRLTESWPEGSQMREKEEERHKRMYGDKKSTR